MTGPAEMVVVGAGPAGLAAAVAAARCGARVVVVDAGHQPGGQYLRQPDLPPTSPGDSGDGWQAAGRPPTAAGGGRSGRRGRAGHGRRATRLLDEAAAAGVEMRTGHQVVTARVEGGRPVLQVLAGGRLAELPASTLVLATGAYDRVLPFPGWDLPGVVTAGGAQALLVGQGVLVGRRTLVAGTGPFLLTVAVGLARAGARVAGVVEASDPGRWARRLPAVAGAPGKLGEAAGYLAALVRHGAPVWPRSAVTSVQPAVTGLRATVERIGPDWRVRPGGRRTVEVDALCVGHGFTPSVELAVALGCATATDPRDGSLVVAVDGWQRTDVPGVLAAGAVTGIGGADLAITEGGIAGLAAAATAGRLDPGGLRAQAGPLLARRRRQRRFSDALHAVYPVADGWLDRLTPDTVLCRCEEVPVGRVRADIVELGADDLRSLRLLSRVGMGRCQGRICGWPAARLLAASTGRDPDLRSMAKRPFIQPIPLRLLAGDEPATPPEPS